jgi:hypothetical protein
VTFVKLGRCPVHAAEPRDCLEYFEVTRVHSILLIMKCIFSRSWWQHDQKSGIGRAIHPQQLIR